jgi:hypothetical protein
MDDAKALKIFESCVNEMYQNSSPPTTWSKIKKKYGGKQKTFYDKHFIKEKIYERIKERYYKKLDKYYRRKLDWFLLDYSPTIKREKNE